MARIDGPVPIRVLIAEGTRMATELVADAISRNSHFKIVRSLVGSADLMRTMSESMPDVVVIGATLDDDSGKVFDLIRELRAFASSAKLVLLVDRPMREAVVGAFRAGARGVFCRALFSINDLCKCIEKVHSGQIWATSDEIKLVLDELAHAEMPKMRIKGLALLSWREQEVVHYVADGLSNSEIGAKLSLSPHTIKNYLCRIFDKLGVSNRAELVFCAFSSAAPVLSPPTVVQISFSRLRDAQ